MKIGEVAVSVLITITAGMVVYVTCICAQLIWPPASKVRSELLSAKRTVVDSEFLNVTFVSNYDGDTFTVDLPGLPKVFGQHIAVRVKHIDTPELKSSNPCAQAAAIKGKELVNTLLRNATSIDLLSVERDKYFRLLAEARIDNKILLHQVLIDNKLAVPYEGDIKPLVDWCN